MTDSSPLTEIRAAELAAARRVDAARELAEERVAAAREEARGLVEESRREARATAEAEAGQALHRAEAQARRIREEGRRAAEDLLSSTEPRLDPVADELLELLLAPPEEWGA